VRHYFERKRADFSDAIAVWAMSYAKKQLAKPLATIIAASTVLSELSQMNAPWGLGSDFRS
jgi:hypothetical protein